MTFLLNWIFGVVGNLVASWIYDAYKQSPTRLVPTQTHAAEPVSYVVASDGHPNRNRQRLAQASERILHRFLSFYFLYAGLALPFMIKTISGREVLLSDARLLGGALPDLPLNGILLQAICILVAIGLSFPVGSLARKVEVAYDRTFGPLSRRERTSISLVTHLTVGSFLAVIVTTFYYHISLFQAAAAVFMVVVAPIALQMTSDRR
jgi:hypothetical protein